MLNKWKKYRPLWKLDKTIMMEKYAAKKPSVVSYDEKLQSYCSLKEQVRNRLWFDNDYGQFKSTVTLNQITETQYIAITLINYEQFLNRSFELYIKYLTYKTIL